jgi:hypothetical protein
MNELSLRNIERRSWRATLHGGLIEILFGIMMFAAALSYLSSDVGASSAVSLVVLVGVQGAGLLLSIFLRRRHIAPRVGHVVFSRMRKKRLLRMKILLAIAVLCTTVMVVLTAIAGRSNTSSLSSLTPYSVAAIVSAVVLLPLGALAYFLEFPRFLLLGLYITAAEFALARFDACGGAAHDEAIVYAALGLIGSTIGWVTFVRFLRRVPRTGPEVTGDED